MEPSLGSERRASEPLFLDVSLRELEAAINATGFAMAGPEGKTAIVRYLDWMENRLCSIDTWDRPRLDRELGAWIASLNSFEDLRGHTLDQFHAWVLGRNLSDQKSLQCCQEMEKAIKASDFNPNSSCLQTDGESQPNGASKKRPIQIDSDSEGSVSSVQFLGWGECNPARVPNERREVGNVPSQMGEKDGHGIGKPVAPWWRRKAGVMNTPPPNYTCRRCGQPGHYLNECPTVLDAAWDPVVDDSYKCHHCGRIGDHHRYACPSDNAPGSIQQRRVQAGLENPVGVNTRDAMATVEASGGTRKRQRKGNDADVTSVRQATRLLSLDDAQTLSHVHESRRALLESSGYCDGQDALAADSITGSASLTLRDNTSPHWEEDEVSSWRDFGGQTTLNPRRTGDHPSSSKVQPNAKKENTGPMDIRSQVAESGERFKPLGGSGPVFTEADFRELFDWAQRRAGVPLEALPGPLTDAPSEGDTPMAEETVPVRISFSGATDQAFRLGMTGESPQGLDFTPSLGPLAVMEYPKGWTVEGGMEQMTANEFGQKLPSHFGQPSLPDLNSSIPGAAIYIPEIRPTAMSIWDRADGTNIQAGGVEIKVGSSSSGGTAYKPRPQRQRLAGPVAGRPVDSVQALIAGASWKDVPAKTSIVNGTGRLGAENPLPTTAKSKKKKKKKTEAGAQAKPPH